MLVSPRGRPEGLARDHEARPHLDYTMNFRFKAPAFPNIYSLKPNLETFLDCGVTEVFEQGARPSVHQAGMAYQMPTLDFTRS